MEIFMSRFKTRIRVLDKDMKSNTVFSELIVPILVGVIVGGLVFELYDYLIGEYPMLSSGSYQFLSMLCFCFISVRVFKNIKRS